MLTWLRDRLADVPVLDVATARQTLVWISDNLLRDLIEDASKWHPRETGAALLGYRSEGAIVVTDLVSGGPRARHRRGSFLPDGRWQAREIARRYGASGRRHTYLGDAHSHPDGSCALSRRDRRTARHISKDDRARAERPLMVLIAPRELRWCVGAWELVDGAIRPCRVKTFRPEQLEP